MILAVGSWPSTFQENNVKCKNYGKHSIMSLFTGSQSSLDLGNEHSWHVALVDLGLDVTARECK